MLKFRFPLWCLTKLLQRGQEEPRLHHTGSPRFTMTFRSANKGLATLSAKDGTDAFLSALRDEDLVIRGDFVKVMCFQGLTAYLQTEKGR